MRRQIPSLPPPLRDYDQERQNPWWIVLILLAVLIALLLALLLALRTPSRGLLGDGGTGGVGAAAHSGDDSGSASNTGGGSDEGLGLQAEADRQAAVDDVDETRDDFARQGPPGDVGGQHAAPTTQDSAYLENTIAVDEEQPDGDMPQDGIMSPSAGPLVIGQFTTGGAELFGVRAAGRNIAFVVDCSASMGAGMHQQHRRLGTRLQVAIDALQRAVEDMEEDQRFFVTFFNTQAIYQESLLGLNASADNRDALHRWLDTRHPHGGTDPILAMSEALTWEVDAIILLSDGEFHWQAVDVITRSNTARIPIHTIGFHTDAKTLREIAEQNYGQYRSVR